MLIFDIEADGLLDTVTKIHCIVIYDTETSEYARYNSTTLNNIDVAVKRLEEADVLLAHFGIGYDYKALTLLTGWKPKGILLDSVVISRLIWTNLKDDDFTKRRSKNPNDLPGNLIGSHGLKAWGYRLGEYKGDFGETADWSEWTQEMEDYCVQDVTVTLKLWNLIQKKNYSETAIKLEHQFATVMNRQEDFGFLFDLKGAQVLLQKLQLRKAELEDKLLDMFPPWEVIVDSHFVPKVNNKKLGYVKGVPFVKKKTVIFNPGSREHIASRLQALYGWKPEAFGNDGKPSVDDSILMKLTYPPVGILREALMLDKRLGQVAEGKQAWLKHIKEDGRIHGRINTNGAVTGRCTHSHPNVAQTPSVGSPYGGDCRALFTVPAGRKLVGADASGLELRCLAHYMARWDKGAYGETVVHGESSKGTDIHTVNQKAAGLPTRDTAKTFIYGFLYGAGDEKIGSIVAPKAGIREKIKKGGELRSKFLKGLPALNFLIQAVKAKAKKDKALKGLDGRVLHVRSDHAALNTLLQSAGAIVMKQALVELDEALKALGYIPGDDYEFVANVHDEWQVEVKEELAERVAMESEKAMVKAGDFFSFKCRIDGESKIGNNWKETH